LFLPPILRRGIEYGTAGWRRLAVARSITGIPTLVLLEIPAADPRGDWLRVTLFPVYPLNHREGGNPVRLSFSVLIRSGRISISCRSSVPTKDRS